MKVQGVKDKLVVQPLIVKEEKKSSGGLILPNAVVTEPQATARVLSVGPEVTKEIKVDDIIYCHSHAGMDITVDNVIMKVLKDEEVYAILKENK